MFLLVLLFAVTIIGESSDLTDDYVDPGDSGEPEKGEGKPTPPKASETTTVSGESLDTEDYTDIEGSGEPDKGEGMPTPSKASEGTVATKEVPSCESLASQGKCKMDRPYRIENASCPAA
nr:unnamed protein product [Haemonchus contortus]